MHRIDLGSEHILHPVEVCRERLALRVWNIEVNHQESVQTRVRVEHACVELGRPSCLDNYEYHSWTDNEGTTNLLRHQEDTRLDCLELTLHTRAQVVILGRRLEVPYAQVQRGLEFRKHVRDDVHLVDTLHLETTREVEVTNLITQEHKTYQEVQVTFRPPLLFNQMPVNRLAQVRYARTAHALA